MGSGKARQFGPGGVTIVDPDAPEASAEIIGSGAALAAMAATARPMLSSDATQRTPLRANLAGAPSAAEIVRALKARLRVVNGLLREKAQLEREKKQLMRLIEAAKINAAEVRPIRPARAG